MTISINKTVAWTSTVVGKTPTTEQCCPTYTDGYPVTRLIVDYRVEGGARITWVLDREFQAQNALVFQLQASQSGVPDADDWIDIGEEVEEAAFLVDDAKRMYGMDSTLHYRIVVTNGATSYTSKPSQVSVNTHLKTEDWLKVREIYRKERLNMTLNTGLRGYLLKEKRYGVKCSCVSDVTQEQFNSSCIECFGRNFVGGYHEPLLCTVGELSAKDSKLFVSHSDARATVNDTTIFGRILADVPIVASDVWVSEVSDERYKVHKVKNVVEFRGVPVVYGVELRLAPKSDVIYKLDVEPSNESDCNWGRTDLDEVETICITA